MDNDSSETLETSTEFNSMTLSEKSAEPVSHLNNQKVRAGSPDVRSEGTATVSLCDSAEVPLGYDDLEIKKLDKVAASGRSRVQETTAYTENNEPEMESVSGKESSLEMAHKVECLYDKKEVFPENDTEKDLTLHLKEEHELLREAVKMALDDKYSFNSYIAQLNEQITAKTQTLHEVENQWKVDKQCLEQKKWSLMESLCGNKPECQFQLQKLKEVDREVHSVLCELKRREIECAILAGDLEKQPKVASRRSYIERVSEITKNCRKLDADVERICKDTRELKLESNSIEERLHRTYAVVDEKIFRNAKKDPVGRQAYRLLTNIHESFEKIREDILAADKAQREIAELEVKLSSISSRSLNKDTLQADLDAMRRENERLEKTLMEH